VEAALRTRDYARVRIGVGAAPPDTALADWVLSPFDDADEARVLELLPTVTAALRAWLGEGVEAAASRFNR
jgi:peptidyl-tRNA hydrolase, PTH1 family